MLAGEIYVAPELHYEVEASTKTVDMTALVVKPDGKLARRQLEVLGLVAEDYANTDIALALYNSEAAIKSHLNSVFQLLQERNRPACVKRAREIDIL